MARRSMSAFDRVILAVAPGWAAARAQSRYRAKAYGSAYEAVEPGRMRKRARDRGNGNAVVAGSQMALRDMARHLDRNHDISRGILDILVRNVVGPDGIGVEPQPRDAAGNINNDLAVQLSELWEKWSALPEVTGELNRARSEHLLARSWFRDGDSFWQYVEGNVPTLTHGTAVPFSLELLESDMCPVDYNDPTKNVLQGVQCNAWGRPTRYGMYKSHPGEPYAPMPELKWVDTAQIGHIKLIDRIGQRRGVSMFASVLGRLDDLKDYEESERIAARIAASMAAFIKKGDPASFPDSPADANAPKRELYFEAGMIFDDLAPGEDIGMIDSKRPNPNAAAWRDGQLRAVSAGAGVSASSASKNYNGTYSAQRQELVEQWGAYSVLSKAFIDQHTAEVYGRWCDMVLLAGLVRLPKGMTREGFKHAVYVPPSMPWIDPLKEVNAYAEAEDRCYVSGPEILRRQGRNPSDVLRAQAKWQQDKRDAGLLTAAAPVPPENDDEPSA